MFNYREMVGRKPIHKLGEKIHAKQKKKQRSYQAGEEEGGFGSLKKVLVSETPMKLYTFPLPC